MFRCITYPVIIKNMNININQGRIPLQYQSPDYVLNSPLHPTNIIKIYDIYYYEPTRTNIKNEINNVIRRDGTI